MDSSRWDFVKLEKLLRYHQPTKYSVKSTKYSDNYSTPVLTPGKSFIKGYTNEKEGIFRELPAIIFDDFTTASKFVTFPFKVKSSAMKILVPRESWVNTSFVFYAMQTLNVRSDTHKRYWLSVYSKQSIPLPPLPEQRAIVAKIEQLFSELDNGIANLKAAQKKLEIYRQAVLKKAFEGELTSSSSQKEHNQNDNPQIKRNVLNLPKKWLWQKIDEISTVSGGLTKSSKRNQLPNKFPYLRVANVYANRLDLSEIKKIGVKPNEIDRVLLKKNDLLVVEGNGSPDQIGRVALWNGQIETCLHQNHLIKIRFDKNVHPKYPLYWLLSSMGREQIKLVASSTSGLYTLSLSKVRSLSVPVCSYDEQAQIVQEIESRLSVCDNILATIEHGLAKSESLRQSILKKAFAGELLTEAELAACRKEPDWEPAEKLLARIERSRNERIEKGEAVQKEKPKKKKSSPVAKNEMSTTRKHAALICKIIQFHDDNPKYSGKLGHVKCEKIAHLAESHLGIELGRKPVKDAAGPDDFRHLKKVESHAQKASLFHTVEKEIGYSYKIGRQAQNVVDQFESSFTTDKLKALNQLIEDFGQFDKEDAEIPATLYAAWNNLLLDGKNPTPEEIVTEARENWSSQKMNIKRTRFLKALPWMREKGYIPQGTGKKVLSPKNK